MAFTAARGVLTIMRAATPRPVSAGEIFAWTVGCCLLSYAAGNWWPLQQPWAVWLTAAAGAAWVYSQRAYRPEEEDDA